ncbi:hypothetical protein ACVMGC_008652 [Bradyrhizobium barranii subsp. barranii]
MRPAPGEIDFALEILDTVDLGRLRRGEAACGHDVVAAGDRRAAAGGELPALSRFVPFGFGDLGLEADVAAQIVAVGNEAEIAQDLGLGRVFLRPGPGVIELRIESVAVVDGLDIAAGAGIAVPVPRAADIAGFLEGDRREAGLAQAMEKIKAGKSGADHGNVDLLGCSTRRFGLTCGDHCVWHGISSRVFCFAGRLSPQAWLVIRTGTIFGSRLRRHRGRAKVAAIHAPRCTTAGIVRANQTTSFCVCLRLQATRTDRTS